MHFYYSAMLLSLIFLTGACGVVAPVPPTPIPVTATPTVLANTPTVVSSTPSPEPPPVTPTAIDREPIVLPISIYILDDTTAQISSQRTIEGLEDVYDKANEIWGQAGIVLDVQLIERVEVSPHYLQAIATRNFQQFFAGVGSDIQLSEPSLLNGFYAASIGGPNGITPSGSRVFFVTDDPSVHDERVTSHEIGHILGLYHVLDDPERLMFSGTNGMRLSEEEIAVARYAARGLLEGVR